MSRILIVDDEPDVHYSFRRLLANEKLEILSAPSGEDALAVLEKELVDLVLMDVRMGGLSGLETLQRLKEKHPKVPVIIMTAYGTTDIAIESMKHGAFDYIQKPFDIPKLKEVIHSGLSLSRTVREVVRFPLSGRIPERGEAIVGRSEVMQQLYKRIGQVAAWDVTVLLTGERGTGKELVARAIYQHSRRARKPYLPMNCAAIPLELLESELFGHERGAFTGAQHRRIGKLEQCHGGTLFLDEVGDMPPATQAKLLRVLQDKTFERVGGNERIQVDVRFIVATNRDLESLIREGRFRPDLYDRLNVVRIHLPPLRDRMEDVPLLVEYFLHRFRKEVGRNVRGISRKALKRLMDYDWPGNVRELQNVLQRAVVLARGETLDEADIQLGSQELTQPPEVEPRELREHLRAMFRICRASRGRIDLLSEMERELIQGALEETRGNQSQAARLLGINRNTLRNKMRLYGLDRD
jgi:nitrogen regulation protein NR(I)